MKKIFNTILTNNVELALNYTMTLKYEEPFAVLNETNISVWWITDLRNSLQALNAKDVEIYVNNVRLNMDLIESIHQVVVECDKIVDKGFQDEEEKYSGPKES